MKPTHGNDAIYHIWLKCEADVILSLEPIANQLRKERGENYIKSEYFLFPLAVEMSSMYNSVMGKRGEKSLSKNPSILHFRTHQTIIFIFKTVRYQD